MKKTILNIAITAGLLTGVAITNSCSEDIADSDRYTAVGQTITEYIAANERFSDFYYLLNKTGYAELLSAYGTYTCFVMNNDSLRAYIRNVYAQEGITTNYGDSITRSVSDSLARDIVEFHLSASKYSSADMEGTTTIRSFLGRDINTSVKGDSILVNKYAYVVSKDNEKSNGVVHEVSSVLTKSNSLVTGELENMSGYSLFMEALETTGLVDSLTSQNKGKAYSLSNGGSNYVPDESEVGYTIFAVSNDVLKNKYGVTNIDELADLAAEIYSKAAQWYDYYSNASISTGSDYTSQYNTLNMFMRYHILKYKVPYPYLVYSWNEVDGVPLYEYYETMLPYTMLKITQPVGTETRYINRWESNNTLTNTIMEFGTGMHDLRDEGVEIYTDNVQALNGYIHPISDIIAYSQTMPQGVLNERMRFDFCSLQPEMMSNGFRMMNDVTIYNLNGKKHGDYAASARSTTDWIKFDPEYFDNIKVYNGENTTLMYLTGKKTSTSTEQWCDYQGDEFLAVGAYDFAFRLPPVPAGTYELRLGYAANVNRGMVQFYHGTSSNLSSMTPLDIPLDMRHVPEANTAIPDEVTGWCLYTKFADNGFATDKDMRNLGYMRGPLYFTVGFDGKISRAQNESLRRIVVTQNFQHGENWIRCKTMLPDNTTTQFHLDYIELCPVSVYNNATYFEDMY